MNFYGTPSGCGIHIEIVIFCILLQLALVHEFPICGKIKDESKILHFGNVRRTLKLKAAD